MVVVPDVEKESGVRLRPRPGDDPLNEGRAHAVPARLRRDPQRPKNRAARDLREGRAAHHPDLPVVESGRERGQRRQLLAPLLARDLQRVVQPGGERMGGLSQRSQTQRAKNSRIDIVGRQPTNVKARHRCDRTTQVPPARKGAPPGTISVQNDAPLLATRGERSQGRDDFLIARSKARVALQRPAWARRPRRTAVGLRCPG